MARGRTRVTTRGNARRTSTYYPRKGMLVAGLKERMKRHGWRATGGGGFVSGREAAAGAGDIDFTRGTGKNRETVWVDFSRGKVTGVRRNWDRNL